MSQTLNPLAPDYVNRYNKQMSPDDYGRYCKKIGEIERCKERAECCVELPVCEPKCADPCDSTKGYFDFGFFGLALLWFIIFTVLFWLIFYSLNPAFTQNEDGTINTSKILLSAIVASIILVLVIWIIYSCVRYSC
jgi:hypothetical protein